MLRKIRKVAFLLLLPITLRLELGKLIIDLLPFVYSDGKVQNVFSPPPIVSYRSARKIKDYLVRSKLYPVE